MLTYALFIGRVELWFTVALAVDIVIRLIIWHPTPKEFFRSKKNNFDLFLATTTLIIQVPPIHDSRIYAYLTIFRILRVYRPVIYIDFSRSRVVSLSQGQTTPMS